MAKLFCCRAILLTCIMGLVTGGCSKTGSLLGEDMLVASPKTGILSGLVSPAEARASVLISNGFFNGREIIFEALADTDPETGRYVIKDIPQGSYSLEMIPSNNEYECLKIQGVVIEPGEPVCLSTSLPKK